MKVSSVNEATDCAVLGPKAPAIAPIRRSVRYWVNERGLDAQASQVSSRVSYNLFSPNGGIVSVRSHETCKGLLQLSKQDSLHARPQHRFSGLV